MRSIVGLLLIALGLQMVMGCALPGRGPSNSDDFGLRSKNATQSQTEPDVIGGLSFKSPTRKRGSESGSTDSQGNHPDEKALTAVDSSLEKGSDFSASTPGHSMDQQTPSNSYDKSSTNSAPTGSRSQAKRPWASETKLASGTYEKSMDSPKSSRDIPFNDRSSGENSPNQIQLQGLEFDEIQNSPAKSDLHQVVWEDPAKRDSVGTLLKAKTPDAPSDSQVPLWADRPANRNVEKLAITTSATNADIEANKQVTESDHRPNTVATHATGQLPPLPWQSDLEQLVRRVENEVAHTRLEDSADKHSEQLRRQAHLRLLYLMAQRQEDALTAIPGIAATQQEYWQQMIWAMSNSFDAVQFPDSTERAAQTVPPLNAALRQVREEAPLAIKNMTFCRKIMSFGNYERFPRNEFTAGQELLLYTEIENFVSAPTVDGEYRTSLKSLIEIADSKGKVVWAKGFPPTEDFCRNPRRDYFQNGQFHIPKDLSTGTYSLKLTIVDELSHKRVSNSLNFVLK